MTGSFNRPSKTMQLENKMSRGSFQPTSPRQMFLYRNSALKGFLFFLPVLFVSLLSPAIFPSSTINILSQQTHLCYQLTSIPGLVPQCPCFFIFNEKTLE